MVFLHLHIATIYTHALISSWRMANRETKKYFFQLPLPYIQTKKKKSIKKKTKYVSGSASILLKQLVTGRGKNRNRQTIPEFINERDERMKILLDSWTIEREGNKGESLV